MLTDRYIFIEWFKVFLLTLFVLFGLLIVSDLQNTLTDVLAFEPATGEVVRYYLIKTIGTVPVVLPVAFMVSLLFSLGQFHKNHEITAMRAAGLSLTRITRSLWVAGALLMALLFQLNASIIPWSVEKTRETWNEFAFSKAMRDQVAEEDVGLIYNLTFFNRRDGRLWFLNRFNEFNYRAYGVTVSGVQPEDGAEVWRLVANEGFYDDLRGGWVFLDGRETTFSAESGDPIRSLPFDRIERPSYREDPDLMKALEKRPKDLSTSELRTVLAYLRPDQDPRLASYAVSYYDRLFSPLTCLIILGLAIPFSVTGVRTNPFVGVSKAMGLLLLYYLLVNVGQLVGAGGFSPVWSALIPNIAAFGLISYYFVRLQHP